MKSMKKQQIETSTDSKIKTYLDMIAPAVVKFNTDHYICGNTFRCVYALREYPNQHIGAGNPPPPW